MLVRTQDGIDVEVASILAALEAANIFSVAKNDDGAFLFTEECDRYFDLALSRAQVMALSDELRAMAGGDGTPA
jgi:hypothetical protein